MIDLSVLFEAIWPSVRWVIPFLLIVNGVPLAFKARVQDWIGEKSVAKGIEDFVHGALHDVIIPDGRGGLTQIDHLLLTDSGVLVVETKSFTGRIFGSERDKTWTQRLGRRSFRIRNPLRQNYGHIKAIETIVGGALPVTGQVVIAGSAEFPKGMPKGTCTRREFHRRIKAGPSGGEVAPSWMAAWREIEKHGRQDSGAVRAHRKQLEKRFGRDSRPAIGIAMILTGVLVTGWFYLV